MTRRRSRDANPSDDAATTDYAAAEHELYDEHGAERYPDPEQAELDKRHAEGVRTWRDHPEARREVCKVMGAAEHKQWQAEVRRQESAAGRRERHGDGDGDGDYGIEYEVKHPDGGNVRYDYVDFKSHAIVDRKPAHRDDTVLDVARRYRTQRTRHVEAYRARYRAEPTYDYALYPSPSELDGGED